MTRPGGGKPAPSIVELLNEIARLRHEAAGDPAGAAARALEVCRRFGLPDRLADVILKKAGEGASDHDHGP